MSLTVRWKGGWKGVNETVCVCVCVCVRVCVFFQMLQEQLAISGSSSYLGKAEM